MYICPGTAYIHILRIPYIYPANLLNPLSSAQADPDRSAELNIRLTNGLDYIIYDRTACVRQA